MIRKIYLLLYKKFNSQGWWPFTLENELHPRHHGISPRNDRERFEIIIGAILTQNTNWKNVEKAIYNLNKESLADIKKIKKISHKKLASLIRPSGYYNQKAERLRIMAEFLSRNPINRLMKVGIEKLREKLLKVKGIGPETADSILLYAFNKPIFVVDAYTKRIFQRIGYKEKSYEELQELFMSNLEKDTKLFNEYHALLVELGKNYCRKKPDCKECPLAKLCGKYN